MSEMVESRSTVQVVARDTPTLTSYLTDISGKLEQLKCHVCLLQELVQSLDCKSGVDILEMKNHLLLRYYCV